MDQNLTLAIGLVITAALVTLACLLGVATLTRSTGWQGPTLFSGPNHTIRFLFDADHLLDATPAARALIRDRGSASAWDGTLARFEPLFPNLRQAISALPDTGRLLLRAKDGLPPGLALRAELSNGVTRLSFYDPDQILDGSDGDVLLELARQDELESLRDLLAQAPLPIWRQNPQGEVIWANTPYLAEASASLPPGQDLTWPLPRLFETTLPGPTGDIAPAPAASLCLPSGAIKHFDLRQSHDAKRAETQCYALPADALRKAEQALRDTTQTLAKTFAQLPIGMAIFDERRFLHMFNPALLDLTGLPVDFLIARPSMSAMLDAMRERAMLPEPRDYRSWRRQLVEMETQASSGLLEDVWNLASGRTYRVTGRPHPNGALAFMLEDISTEIGRSRRLRADLALGQAVIDALGDAIVVLGQDGSLTMANAAARQLWGEDAISTALAEPGRNQLLALWRGLTAPSLLWNDLEQFIGQFGPRDTWEGELRLRDGRPLGCRISPLAHAATLIAFRLIPKPAQQADAAGDSRAILIA